MLVDKVTQRIEHEALHKYGLYSEIIHYRVLRTLSAFLNIQNNDASTFIRASAGHGFYPDNVGMVTSYRC